MQDTLGEPGDSTIEPDRLGKRVTFPGLHILLLESMNVAFWVIGNRIMDDLDVFGFMENRREVLESEQMLLPFVDSFRLKKAFLSNHSYSTSFERRNDSGGLSLFPSSLFSFSGSSSVLQPSFLLWLIPEVSRSTAGIVFDESGNEREKEFMQGSWRRKIGTRIDCIRSFNFERK